MGFHRVALPLHVSGEKLEQACKEAAEEMGYRSRDADEHFVEYTLGSVERQETYEETNLRIGNFLPALQVRGIHRGRAQDAFFIRTGPPHGYASERKVMAYLSKVSERLQRPTA